MSPVYDLQTLSHEGHVEHVGSDVGAVLIQQTPASISHSTGSPVRIQCVYTKADASSAFSWYRWHPDREPENLFYSYATGAVNPSGEVDGFTARRPDNTHFYLESSSLWANKSAVYYCAWRLHSDSERRRSSAKTLKGRKALSTSIHYELFKMLQQCAQILLVKAASICKEQIPSTGEINFDLPNTNKQLDVSYIFIKSNSRAEAIQPIEPGPAVRKSYPIQHQSDTSNESQIQRGSSSLFKLLPTSGCYYSVIPRSEGSEGNPASSAVISTLCFIFSRLILVHEQIQPSVCRMQFAKLFLIVCSLLPCRTLAEVIHQWPTLVVMKRGEPAELNCSRNDSRKSIMLWYRQYAGQGLTLMGHSYTGSSPIYEGRFEEEVKILRPEERRCSLRLLKVKAADAAVYYCAAREHSTADCLGASTKTNRVNNTTD
ncbi:uncharacterized protein [Heterodontus francisci]|uniref:uncharacterized protein n=1 Tax=Heterodontus francisci TaxID=7792 RepID=UPI00355C38F9